MGERVSPDKPWFICMGCDNSFSRRSAPKLDAAEKAQGPRLFNL